MTAAGDRFRVKPFGGYDEHLWGKTGMVLATYIIEETNQTMATYIIEETNQTMVKAKMDTPSVHPIGFTVSTFFDYLDSFEKAVEPE